MKKHERQKHESLESLSQGRQLKLKPYSIYYYFLGGLQAPLTFPGIETYHKVPSHHVQDFNMWLVFSNKSLYINPGNILPQTGKKHSSSPWF